MDTSPVDQIKERLSIADVVGSYVKLERAGVNFKARCPFHSEKTPSFFVSPARGTYHCFGCNRGGDIFSFVEEIEGVPFPDALKILADRAGVVLKSVNPKEKSEYDKLYSLMETSVSFYEERLRENNEALVYLKNRGLTDETIRAWRLGFATESWGGLHDNLIKRGYSEADAEKAGFLVKGNRGPYDRFRSRIMFPLANASGKTIGFSGRIFLPYDKAKEKELAKYVNSPDTVLYNKSRVLYGYDKAKSEMMRENTCVLVEGQMDLLMSHQAGIKNAVALSGTALTEDHLRMIKRFADNLVLALDSDAAGFAASERAWRLAISLGLDVKVAKLPEGDDPAELARKDPSALMAAIAEAKHIIDFLLEGIKERGLDKRTFLSEIGKKVLPYVAEISNKIDQAHFVGKISGEMGIGEEHIWEEIAKLKRKAEPALSANLKEKSPAVFRKDFIARKIQGVILWQEGLKEPAVDISSARGKYEKLVSEYGLSKLSDISGAKDSVFESELYYTGHVHLEKELLELFVNLERELLEEKFGEAMRELALAEKSGQSEKTDELMKKCQEVSKKLNEIKSRNF